MTADRSGEGRGGGRGRLSAATPIADEDAERGILGALLTYGDPHLTLRVVGRTELKAEHFYWEHHGAIFAAIFSLARAGIGGDAVTLYAEMEQAGAATESTREQLVVLPSYIPPAGNYVQYAERVVSQARWRERLRVTYEMLGAIEQRNEQEWTSSAAAFLPASKELPEKTSGPSLLRLVNESGEVVDEQVYCEGCRTLQDQLDGATKEIAGWRTRYGNLNRDKEREARANAWYLPAQALFENWKNLTGHKNSKWTTDRFLTAEPLLRKYGVEIFARAIAGIANDPYTKLRRNGTLQKYDSWATLTKNADAFEEYANRAPKGWRFTLNITGGQVEEQQPRLQLAEEAS